MCKSVQQCNCWCLTLVHMIFDALQMQRRECRLGQNIAVAILGACTCTMYSAAHRVLQTSYTAALCRSLHILCLDVQCCIFDSPSPAAAQKTDLGQGLIDYLGLRIVPSYKKVILTFHTFQCHKAKGKPNTKMSKIKLSVMCKLSSLEVSKSLSLLPKAPSPLSYHHHHLDDHRRREQVSLADAPHWRRVSGLVGLLARRLFPITTTSFTITIFMSTMHYCNATDKAQNI